MKGFKDVLILTIIALIAGISLSFVYASTKAKIAESKKAETDDSLKQLMTVIAEQARYVEEEYEFEGQKYPIYVYRDASGSLLGAAVRMVNSEGYAGNIVVLVGIDKTKSVLGLKIMEHRETPGLGTKATDKSFWQQYVSKSRSNFNFKVKKDGGDVDAITAATITSRAVSRAVEKSLELYEKYSVERGAI